MIGQAISNSRRAGGEVRFPSQEVFSPFLCCCTLPFGLMVFCLFGAFFSLLPHDFWHDSIIRTSSCSGLGVCWTASSSSWTSAPRPWLIRGRRRIPWLLFASETSSLALRRAWGLPSWDLGKGMWQPCRKHCPGVWPAPASTYCRVLLVSWNFISICNSSPESWKEEKLLCPV